MLAIFHQLIILIGQIRNSYRISSVLKVETDFIASIATSPIGDTSDVCQDLKNWRYCFSQ
jgi:hypothetical protein